MRRDIPRSARRYAFRCRALLNLRSVYRRKNVLHAAIRTPARSSGEIVPDGIVVRLQEVLDVLRVIDRFP
jgi:hypothetical protein